MVAILLLSKRLLFKKISGGNLLKMIFYSAIVGTLFSLSNNYGKLFFSEIEAGVFFYFIICNEKYYLQ